MKGLLRMEIAYLLEKCLNEEAFYVGIIAGLIMCFCFSMFKKDRIIKEREKTFREISIISLLIKSMHTGDKILIEDYFHETKVKNIVYSARYNAWKAFIYWIAHQCATYSYSQERAEDILALGKICFGEKSISYQKLLASETIINYSTKLYLDEKRNLYRRKKIEEFNELFDLVDAILNSTYIDKY